MTNANRADTGREGGLGSSTDSIASRVADLDWYHTFDLPGGIVTDGLFDHRKVVSKLPIPESLAGKRCLDAASADGFFAFEMARRGADEVVSVDLSDSSRQDWQRIPTDEVRLRQGTGRATRAFEVVRDATGLDVERLDRSLYELDPDDVGHFDFVFMGNILLHLSDPAKALRALATVTVPGGTLLSYEAISLPMTVLRPRTPAGQLWHEDHGQWWTPNMVGHRRLLFAGDWDVYDSGGPLFQPFGNRMRKWPASVPRGMRELIFWTCTRRFGGATAWALAHPRTV